MAYDRHNSKGKGPEVESGSLEADRAITSKRPFKRMYHNVEATKWTKECTDIYKRGKHFLPNRALQLCPHGMRIFHVGTELRVKTNENYGCVFFKCPRNVAWVSIYSSLVLVGCSHRSDRFFSAFLLSSPLILFRCLMLLLHERYHTSIPMTLGHRSFYLFLITPMTSQCALLSGWG